MKRKQRFIIDFTKFDKETFLALVAIALSGINGNPDFVDAPYTYAQFKAANQPMVDAAPNAVRSNIEGLRIFKPLRKAVEGIMTAMCEFAQNKIGNDPERMAASGLPLTKEPTARPIDINIEVQRPKVEPGDTEGKINVSAKPNRAAEGIIIEERQADMTYIEKVKVVGFKAVLGGYAIDQVVVVQIRYWNNEGVGPRMNRPLAIVV